MTWNRCATFEVPKILRRNDTMEAIFRRMSLDKSDLAAIRNLPGIRQSMDFLKPGDAIRLTHLERGAIKELSRKVSETQTLTVTAVSNNTSLIPHPTVTYTSPNTTGSLSYTPVANANGSAIITVTVDDGGTGTHTVVRTFTVDVTAVNDQPTIADIPDQPFR